MAVLTSFTHAIALQQLDPVAFLDTQHDHRPVWWQAWLLRGGMVLAVVAALGLGANERQWKEMVLCATSWLALVLVLCAIAVTLTGQLQFWLLYAFSPPILVALLLSGLAPLSPRWSLLGERTSIPFLIGVLVSDTYALWVHKRLQEIQHERGRMRVGGPASELPALDLWQQARLARLGVSTGMVILALWLLRDWVFALSSLAGGLRLEAILLAWIQGSPMVRFNQQRGEWHATYAGRSAAFVPHKLVRLPAVPARSQSAAILALLQQGCLGPVVRQVVQDLPPDQARQLLLHLSTQEGGATAILYLKPALAPELHPAAACYAALAAEAARAFDLQRWVAVLAKQCLTNTDAAGTMEDDLLQILHRVRDALLTFTYTPQLIDTAINDLEQLARSLYNLPHLLGSPEQPVVQLGTLPLAWPVALLLHLEEHRSRLLSA
ncbi:MAG: hypothetical protein JW850_13720 [Thermoflexales bacterium]|nr:hypothetical protein [Thermoflexales bacterium]